MISDMCKHTYLGKGLLAIVDAKQYLNEHDKFKLLPIGIHAFANWDTCYIYTI